MKNRILIPVLIAVLVCSCKPKEEDEPVLIALGEEYKGGIIAYILQQGDPGFDPNVQHGLIIAPADQGRLVIWSDANYKTTGATGSAIGSGNENTNRIVAIQGSGSYAARICFDLVLDGYSDWFLPSLEELQKMYLNRAILGIPDDSEYWSSTEISTEGAWAIYFGNGSSLPTFKDFPDRVRAVRVF